MTEIIEPVMLDDEDKVRFAQQLVAQARSTGVDLVGPDGLLSALTKQVLETALKEELTETWVTSRVSGTARPGRTNATGRGRRP